MAFLSAIRQRLARFKPVPMQPNRVVAHSPKMHDLVAKDAAIERLASGFRFTEGPVWREDRKALWFSDIPANTIHEWRDGHVRTVRKPSGHANGNTLDGQGRLLTCEHSRRQVSRTNGDGTLTPLATHWQEKRLNSPNDLIVKSDGSIYFTDL